MKVLNMREKLELGSSDGAFIPLYIVCLSRSILEVTLSRKKSSKSSTTGDVYKKSVGVNICRR